MRSDYYSDIELEKIGFKSYGKNILLSRKCSIYNPENICIGNNVRIDDFCILSGSIIIGNYVHIAAYSALYGKFGIEICDYSGISARCTLYSAIDDFSGNYMISPMVPLDYVRLTKGKITLSKYTQLGCNTIVFPNVTIKEGSVVGAMSLVKNSVPEWLIVAGIPVKVIKKRKKNLLKFTLS